MKTNEEVKDEGVISTLKDIAICESHTKDTWTQGTYVDNHDGTVTCKFCPQGYRLAGYMRCINEKIVDLRSASRN